MYACAICMEKVEFRIKFWCSMETCNLRGYFFNKAPTYLFLILLFHFQQFRYKHTNKTYRSLQKQGRTKTILVSYLKNDVINNCALLKLSNTMIFKGKFKD